MAKYNLRFCSNRSSVTKEITNVTDNQTDEQTDVISVAYYHACMQRVAR